jgi:two-component system, cell cycle response regulator
MRILVADDSGLSRRILRDLLSRWGYEVVVCADGDEAFRELQAKDAPVIAILDWEMPGMNGVEICRKIREQSREPYTYVILLTANDRKEAVVEGLAAGADDYVRKPFNEQELEVRLRAGKRVTDLESELIKAREILRAQATHDTMTGLLNRAAILDILDNELARSQREKTSLALLLVDLDHFKNVNDTWGHQVGDAALCEAARRMQSSLRSYDSLGRFGGEEFLVVVPGCTDEHVLGRANHVREALCAGPMNVGGQVVDLTGSVGGVVSRPGGDHEPKRLLKSADDALYRAKRAGRNRVEIA